MSNYDLLILDDGLLLTDQEQFVLDQVEKGEFADLALEFGPNLENRQIRAQFLEKLLTEGFRDIKIHRIGVRIKNAVISEKIKLENAVISNFVDLRYCLFLSDVILRHSHFNKILSFTGSIFFKKADFYRIKVDMSFFIRNAIFEKSANFGFAFIGSNLEARGTHFKENEANFNSIKVAQSVNFFDTKFESSVDLIYLNASNLFLRGIKDKIIKIGNLKLRNALLERELDLRYVEIDTLNLKDIQINGPLILINTIIKEKIELNYASLKAIKIDNVQFPNRHDSIILDGLTYNSISIGEGKDDWRKLIEFVEIANFRIQNYSELEKYFKLSGQQEAADEVYVRGKRRELRNQKWGHPKRWATWLLWDKLTNYGRKPSRTIWVSLFIIIIGAFVIDPNLLKPELLSSCSWLSHGNYYQNIIIRLILSFNHFLPAIDLGLTKELQLSNMSFYTFLYLQIHKICGWILIPIGLAAIYTQIKKA